RHGFPRWGIVNPDATTPTRDHGVTGGSVARSTHYPASNDVGRSTRRESKDVARSTRDVLGTKRYEHVGLAELEPNSSLREDLGSTYVQNSRKIEKSRSREIDDDGLTRTTAGSTTTGSRSGTPLTMARGRDVVSAGLDHIAALG